MCYFIDVPEGKIFVINNRGRSEQYVSVSNALGRILLRQEVDEIVGSFGSEVKKSQLATTIDIVPPIPKDELHKFGEALVHLAVQLDPSEPQPKFKIT